MRRAATGIALALLAGSAFSQQVAAPAATVRSPNQAIAIELRVSGEGRPEYRIERRNRTLVDWSRLGFILANAPKLERNFGIAQVTQRAFDDTWEQPWGERRFVRNHGNEMRVSLREKAGRELVVVFRVFDDGVGFRYEFPQQPQLEAVDIVEEQTEFAIAEPATAWWIPGGEWNRYEYLYNKTPLSEVSQAHTPLTLKLASGVHIAIHEAALVDYSGMWLRRVSGQRLKAALSPATSGPRVHRRAPFVTPWRTLQIADDAPGLYMSDLILNLNEPNKLGDVSWVKPFKYVGIWWGMHLGTHTWSSGPKHGATTAETKRYIDFAAANGFRGVLVEGWNKGWDGDWFARGDEFSFTEPYADFDIVALTAYARKKGVRLVGHHETAGNIAVYEKQLGAALDLYQKLGIDSVKTGYVADAGGVQALGADGRIHFEWHDGQVQARHHLHVVQEAAKRHIAVNPHEPIKDTGLRRTYPNWVSREGARGMEYNAWGDPPNPPEHEVNLVFTRMLAGPMDYTPGVLSLTGANGKRIQSTIARQLALYVVLYSPIQMAADLPENYARFPGPFQFIKDVPVDWAETRVLNGEAGDYVTMARKDRASENWFLGAITDENPRNLKVPLTFLDEGRRYRATIYRDGADAGFAGDPGSIEIETRTVTRGDVAGVAAGPWGRAGRALLDQTPWESAMNAVTANAERPTLTFWQIWNMCFGFMGIQFAFALQNGNVSYIFQTLGAKIEDLAILWIAAPLTGLIVQPIVGHYSDRTWNRLGRRRPYFLAGAILTSLALIGMPHSSVLWMAAGMLWVLDASINISMEPFRAFVADQLPDRQRPAGYAMQTFFIGVGAVVAGFMPYWLAKAGVSNVGSGTGASAIADTVRYSFFFGAAVLFVALLWTVLRTREYPPTELHAFADATAESELIEPGRAARARRRGAVWLSLGIAAAFCVLNFALEKALYILAGGFAAWGLALLVFAGRPGTWLLPALVRDIDNMPARMRELVPVQFFSWVALFCMWIYATPTVAQEFFGSTDPHSEAYGSANVWWNVLGAVYNGVAALAAILTPFMVRRFGLKVSHLINLSLGAAGLISFAVVPDSKWLIASMVGVGFAWGSILSLPYALLAGCVPSRKMGVYMGIFNFFIVIPQIVATSALGSVLKHLLDGRPLYVLVLGGVSFLLAGVLALRVK